MTLSLVVKILRRALLVLPALSTLCLFSAQPGWAYKTGTISVDSAELKVSADPDSQTVTVLPQGSKVNTTDSPTQGFYRARSATASGWVKEADVSFGPAKPAATSNPKTAAPKAASRRKTNQKPLDWNWTAKVFAGADTFGAGDVTNYVGSDSLKTGAGIGFELGYRTTPNLTWIFRFEHLAKSSTGPDLPIPPAPANTVQLTLSSTPVMVGVDYTILPGNLLSLDLSGLVGSGLGTKLSSVVNNSPNATEYAGSPLTVIVKADLNWKISEAFWLYSELGYRSLKLASAPPSKVGDGSSFFAPDKAAPTQLTSLSIDMSGILFNLGGRFNF